MNAVRQPELPPDRIAPGAPQSRNSAESREGLDNQVLFVKSRAHLCAFHLLLIVSFGLFLCFYNLGTGANMGTGTGIDESWYIQAAQEMKASGRWWLPTREGEIFFYKPPLKLWITEICSAMFGDTMVAYRCADAFLGMVYLLFTYAAAGYLFRSLNAGLFAALALMSCHNFLFVNGVRNNTLDILMTLLCSIALLLLWHFTERQRARLTRREQMLKGAAVGFIVALSALTKSVNGYYLYGVFAVWLLISGNLRFCLRERIPFLLAVGGMSVLMPALWFVPHALFTPGAWQVMFGYELMARFSHGFHHSNDSLYYWKQFTGNNLFPPLISYLAAVYAVGKLLSADRSLYTLLLTWVAVPFIVFSALPSRLAWYIVPCFFPMALLIGAAAGKAFEMTVNAGLDMRARGASGWMRSLVRPVLYCCLLGAFVWPMGESIFRNASKVYEGQPRLAINEVVEEIQELIDSSPEDARVFEYNHPPFATRERIFINMLSDYSGSVHSVAEIKARIQTGALSFFFTDFDTAGEIVKQFPEAHYRELTPVKFNQASNGILRTEPMIVLAAGAGAKKLAQFHRVSSAMSDEEKERCRYSLYTQGGSISEETCTLEGDDMRSKFPTSLTLKFSKLLLDLGEDASMDIFLDARHLKSIPNVKSAGRKQQLVIPAGAWKRRNNNLTIRISSPGGLEKFAPSKRKPLLDRVTVSFEVL